MSRIFRTACVLVALITACSTLPAPTVTPSSHPPSPSPIATIPPILPTLAADTIALQSNVSYAVHVTFSSSQPVRVNLQGAEAENDTAFELTTQDFAYALPAESNGEAWGMPYLLHALNVPVASWDHPYSVVRGSMVISPAKERLAYYLCNESGGRGQWCYGGRLWMFNTETGETTLLDLNEAGLLSVFNLQFSEDSQMLSAQGCISYPNPYFGWCATTVSTRWDVENRNQVDMTIIATQDVHYP